jgi:hypothetical protein
MRDSSRKLVGYWKSLNLTVAAGIEKERVLEFESHYGVVLPADFREYFLDVNGMLQRGGQDCDPNGFAFWPLGHVKSVREEYAEHSTALPEVPEPHVYFVFADYLQWCWAYAIRLYDKPVGSNLIITVGTLKTRVIASSFTEFVGLYLWDAKELYADAASSDLHFTFNFLTLNVSPTAASLRRLRRRWHHRSPLVRRADSSAGLRACRLTRRAAFSRSRAPSRRFPRLPAR